VTKSFELTYCNTSPIDSFVGLGDRFAGYHPFFSQNLGNASVIAAWKSALNETDLKEHDRVAFGVVLGLRLKVFRTPSAFKCPLLRFFFQSRSIQGIGPC
jgi:hypothetical protein